MLTRTVLLAALIAACGGDDVATDDADDLAPDATLATCSDAYDLNVARNTECELQDVLGVPDTDTETYGQTIRDCEESRFGRIDCEAERGALVECWEAITDATCGECVDELEAFAACAAQ